MTCEEEGMRTTGGCHRLWWSLWTTKRHKDVRTVRVKYWAVSKGHASQIGLWTHVHKKCCRCGDTWVEHVKGYWTIEELEA